MQFAYRPHNPIEGLSDGNLTHDPQRAHRAALVSLDFRLRCAQRRIYPAEKITVIVAFAPGGIADTLARLIGQGSSERLHQTVVVENRGGAGGNIAAAYVARANPDGYTLLATTTALAINETLFADKQFSTSDFKTVAIAASSPEALVTSPDNPAKDLPDFVKSITGVRSISPYRRRHRLAISKPKYLKQLAKVAVQPIPYQGGAPAINATIAGQVDLMATTLGGGAAAQIAGGKLKGLGIAADKRAAVAPNVPTYAEQGYPAFTAASWVGFFALRKTDPHILQDAQRGDQRYRQEPGRSEEAYRHGLRPDRRLAGAGRRHVHRRGQEMRRHGQGARTVDQIAARRCQATAAVDLTCSCHKRKSADQERRARLGSQLPGRRVASQKRRKFQSHSSGAAARRSRPGVTSMRSR